MLEVPSDASIKELVKDIKPIDGHENVHVEKKDIVIHNKLMIYKRPEVISARVYKLKSAFVEDSLYITLAFVDKEDGTKMPFEIFINSKDLTKSAEYTVLTRLISAIFRRSDDPTFIIEELASIYDPNGGHFKEGKYYHSIYGEIGDVIACFFSDIGILKRKVHKPKAPMLQVEHNNMKVCPKCGSKTLKVENGCNTCINPECAFSKCDS